MTARAAYVASARFGLGPGLGELARIAPDPRGWALAQLVPGKRQAASAGETGTARMRHFQDVRRSRGDAGIERLLRQEWRAVYVEDAARRLRRQIETDTPLYERLVSFWSNHFTVSVQRPPVLGLALPFEDEAIRPHVVGRFFDMLHAVARHPAMLVYLDQAQSAGPNSAVGARRGRGLNENLAREVLELHTLGVAGGYVQTDVREFARILTGWSLGAPGDADAGAFRFRPEIHEPGPKSLLGRRFAEDGEGEGIAALAMLARHPSTARHVASKLVRHFVADDPPPLLVETLVRLYRDTDGDLGVLVQALVEAPESWSPPLSKVRAPVDLIVAALRACDVPSGDDRRTIIATAASLGQPVFAAPSPAGWPDRAEHWIGPESALRRAEWARALAGRIAPFRRPDALFDASIAPVAARATRDAVLRAPSAADGLAMLFASPEFQRR